MTTKKVIRKKGSLVGVEAVYSGWKGAAGVSLTLTLLADKSSSDLVLEVYGASRKIDEVYVPAALTVPRDPASCVVVPEGQGAVIPGDWQGEFIAPLGWSSPVMPWFGACQGDAGLMVFVETDDDYHLPIIHPAGGPPSVGVRWVASMGSMRYARRVRLRLLEEADYVALAMEYRRRAREDGLLVPLEEKAKTRPEIEQLRTTAAMIAGGICTHDLRRMYRKVTRFDEVGARVRQITGRAGLERVVLHLDGWGVRGYDNLHPDVLPPCPEAGGAEGMKALSDELRRAGHLFCLHDNYRDIYFDAPSCTPDVLQVDPDGGNARVQMWAGGLNSLLCAEPALRLLKRNLVQGMRRQWERWPGILQLVGPTALYIDNYCMDYECYSREHPVNRGQSRLGVRALYDFVQSHGLVACCEHIKSWALPKLDMCYNLDHLRARWMGPDHAPVGDYVGVPVPLWNLVFRDVLVQHTHTYQFTGAGNERWRHAMTFAFLAADMPNLVATGELDDAFWQTVDRLKPLADLHRRVAFDRMVDHQFLGPDGRSQLARYESGVEVRANYDTGEIEIAGAGKLDGKRTVE